jgi:hypothetical protein
MTITGAKGSLVWFIRESGSVRKLVRGYVRWFQTAALLVYHLNYLCIYNKHTTTFTGFKAGFQYFLSKAIQDIPLRILSL